MFSMLKKSAGLGVALALLTAPAASAAPALSFIVDGDTFFESYVLSNTSTAGETLLSFRLDLAGAGGDLCFDVIFEGPCNATPNNATPFTPQGTSVADTGLLSSTVDDGGTTLDLTFGDFDPGEVFEFLIDVDPASDVPVSGSTAAFGDTLIGATVLAVFSNRQQLSGVLGPVNDNDDASAFELTGVTEVPLPAGLPLLGAGLAFAGLLGWRRRRRTA